MSRLLEDQRGKNGLMLSAWENDFVASYSSAGRKNYWFTEGRRDSVDKMWRRYGGELKFPHPLDCVPQRPAVPEAAEGGCQFMVRGDDATQRRCNEPAVCREPRKLRYCQAHREQVERAVKGIIFIPS